MQFRGQLEANLCGQRTKMVNVGQLKELGPFMKDLLYFISSHSFRTTQTFMAYSFAAISMIAQFTHDACSQGHLSGCGWNCCEDLLAYIV